jgi:hypothetical protein
MTAFLSEHRFRLMLAACTVALALMLIVIHGTVGLHLPRDVLAEGR